MLTFTIFAVFVLVGIARSLNKRDLLPVLVLAIAGSVWPFIGQFIAENTVPGTPEETFTYHDLVTNTDYVCTRPALPTYDGSWIPPGLSIDRFDTDDSHATCYERN